jgi:hypothetical protein
LELTLQDRLVSAPMNNGQATVRINWRLKLVGDVSSVKDGSYDVVKMASPYLQ